MPLERGASVVASSWAVAYWFKKRHNGVWVICQGNIWLLESCGMQRNRSVLFAGCGCEEAERMIDLIHCPHLGESISER